MHDVGGRPLFLYMNCFQSTENGYPFRFLFGILLLLVSLCLGLIRWSIVAGCDRLVDRVDSVSIIGC
jgi:hypothetical protein